MPKKEYDFGEKKQEKINGETLEVCRMPRYEQSRQKAIELIEANSFLNPGDFWILKNKTKTGKMAYSGLIISHNACLKLNKAQPPEKQFKVECLTSSISDYNSALLYEYISPEQGLYEVGEVTTYNCKNDYPHAMAFKRLFDRVVLKLTGIAFEGIYSDSEADEFKEPVTEKKAEQEDGYACEVCGTIVHGTNKRTATELEKASRDKYNQALCGDCAKGVEEYEKKIKQQEGEK